MPKPTRPATTRIEKHTAMKPSSASALRTAGKKKTDERNQASQLGDQPYCISFLSSSCHLTANMHVPCQMRREHTKSGGIAPHCHTTPQRRAERVETCLLRRPTKYIGALLPTWRNWQTRQTQNLVLVRVCGFDPLRRHHISPDFLGCQKQGSKIGFSTPILLAQPSKPVTQLKNMNCSPNFLNWLRQGRVFAALFVLFFTFTPVLPAAIIGTNSPTQPLTAGRIAALPRAQQPVWKEYLKRSTRQN